LDEQYGHTDCVLRDGGIMAKNMPENERPKYGQSIPLGDTGTGDGGGGVRPDTQGISNREGDRDQDTDDLMKDEDDTDGNV